MYLSQLAWQNYAAWLNANCPAITLTSNHKIQSAQCSVMECLPLVSLAKCDRSVFAILTQVKHWPQCPHDDLEAISDNL